VSKSSYINFIFLIYIKMDIPINKLPKPKYTEKLIKRKAKEVTKLPDKFKYLDDLLPNNFKNQYFNKK